LFFLSKKTKKWIHVEGEILKAELSITKNMGEELMTSYNAKVKYQYTVDRKKYVSLRIFYGDYMQTNLSRNPENTIKKYSEAKKVDVYYNPTKPSCSVLETGINSFIYKELFIGILFLVISFSMILKESVFRSIF
jgi:hypothetical protein